MNVGELREKLKVFPDHHEIVVRDDAARIDSAELLDVFSYGGCQVIIEADCQHELAKTTGCC